MFPPKVWEDYLCQDNDIQTNVCIWLVRVLACSVEDVVQPKRCEYSAFVDDEDLREVTKFETLKKMITKSFVIVRKKQGPVAAFVQEEQKVEICETESVRSSDEEGKHSEFSRIVDKMQVDEQQEVVSVCESNPEDVKPDEGMPDEPEPLSDQLSKGKKKKKRTFKSKKQNEMSFGEEEELKVTSEQEPETYLRIREYFTQKFQEQKVYADVNEMKDKCVKVANEIQGCDLYIIWWGQETKYVKLGCKYQSCRFQLWYTFDLDDETKQPVMITPFRKVNFTHKEKEHKRGILRKVEFF